MIKKLIKNKKALSEIVSYVLLISMALGLAVGVYSFMKFYVPKENANTEKCNEDVSLIIANYACIDSLLFLKIENKGLFNVNGFILKYSTNSSKIPTEPLNATNKNILENFNPGFYDFIASGDEKLKPGNSLTINFSFKGIKEIERLTLQPYTFNKAGDNLILCEKITDIRLDQCTNNTQTTTPIIPDETPTEEPPASETPPETCVPEIDDSNCISQGYECSDYTNSCTGTTNNYCNPNDAC